MIDEEQTFEKFGYRSFDLLPQSSKRIIAICNGCGEVRELYKFAYNDLCRSCAQLKISDEKSKVSKELHKDPVFKEMHGIAVKEAMYRSDVRDKQLKGINDPKNRKNISKKLTDVSKSDEARKNMKIAQNRSDIKNANRDRILGNKNPSKRLDVRKKISESLTGKYVGSKSPNWKGGLSFEPYCSKFNEKLKQQVRDQYDNCDFMSGLPDYICNVLNGKVWKLDVHHVDSNKMQGCDDHEWKLVPLSRSNHGRTHNNRPFWERLICYAFEYETCYNEYIWR